MNSGRVWVESRKSQTIRFMTYFKFWLATVMFLAGGRAGVWATGTAEADAILSAYNTAFYATNSNGDGFFENDTTRGGAAYFWGQAEEIEMLLDCCDRTNSPALKTQVTQICNGFVDNNGSLWTGDEYNDDISWAVIAFARAYLATGNTTFRNLAKTNFDAMYSRAWDTNFAGGGLWWSTDKGGKNACINGPAAVAAGYLYNIYGDSSYLNKAAACYAWERSWLFNTNTGAISDSISTSYSINTWASTYNQGTFIGAANFLYQATRLPFYYQDAILAARYTQNSIASAGIMPEYGSGDFGGFNGIFVRWMGKFGHAQNLWATFGPWMGTNASAAWNVRNTNNLSWEKWNTATPAGTNVLASWDCSDSVVVMQVGLTNAPEALQITPGAGFATAAQAAVAPNAAAVSLVLSNAGSSSLNWSLINTSAWLSASAASGTLSAGQTNAVAVSLAGAAVTNLAAGGYYASVVCSNASDGVAQARTFALVISGGSAPIAVTGYNAGVLAPNTAANGAAGAAAFDVANNYGFYQAGLGAATRGLPPDGVFTSQADASTVFQLQAYGGTNALVLGYNHATSGTLTLVTPRAYNFISILACSANASGGNGTLVLKFTNGTQSQALSYNVQDWFGTTTNVALQGAGRLKLSNPLAIEDDGAANPNFYQTTLNLAALGLSQPVTSITFSTPSSLGTYQDCGIFAVSGTVMPAAANLVRQPQSVTNTVPAQGAAFNVVASGTPPLAYQWFYSTNGSAGTYAALAGQATNSLSLGAVLQLTNAGSFYVVVTNSFGAVTSSVATLTVYRAPVLTQLPAPTNVWCFAGWTNTWTVAASAAAPVGYYWFQNGTNLPWAMNAACQIKNVQSTNSGNYFVVVSNAFGTATSGVVSLTVVAAPHYPYGLMVLTNGALGYWRLDETNGTVAHDYVGGHNGTYTATVLLGQAGNSVLDAHKAAGFGSLAVSNSCVTNIAVDFGTSGNGEFSVEAWVYGGTQSSDAGIVTKGYGSGGEQFNLDCGGSSHAFRFFFRDASGSAHLATSSVVPNSQWHHLVGVCDEANGNVYLYVDVTNVAQGTLTPYSGVLSSSQAVSIGSRQAGTAPIYANQFAGRIEEVAIYGLALSSNQVAAHYQLVTNYAPMFLTNPLTLTNAPAGVVYAVSVATNVVDPNDDVVSFAKVSGPAWLSWSTNGGASGTPLSANAGTNIFVISASDPGGLSNTATVHVTVLPAAPIVSTGLVSGASLVLNWSGGISPYQVQMATNLASPAWQNVASVSTNRVSVAMTNGAAFYRISGQ